MLSYWDKVIFNEAEEENDKRVIDIPSSISPSFKGSKILYLNAWEHTLMPYVYKYIFNFLVLQVDYSKFSTNKTTFQPKSYILK